MNDFYDTSVRTDDIAATYAWLRAQYGHVDLQADDAVYAERLVGDGAFALRRLEWDSRVDLAYESDRFYVCSSTPGYAWRIGRWDGEFSVAPGVIQPGDELRALADHCRLDVVSFDAERLTQTACTIYGDDELTVRFAGTDPVSPRLRDYWLATQRWALTQLPVLAEPLVRAHVYRALSVAALESFALVGDPRERRASAAAQASIYNAAAAWIDDHASLPVTVDDAARAAGTSVDGLRRAFAANGQVVESPEGYLELARLSAAHADLLDAHADETSTEQVAARWGFGDPAVFATAYRAAYGVSPRTTLER
ncbi:helix-turn-helix transcriptional regulator [Microbacterium sp. KSW2-21]|uniref:Helix-turn-helix transcriptional regulator n=1 Tax=Microbacterium algihabitans TaxID=3075992 RepID=A0ABU3RVY2_9MICO|nr:helix-turn-helix transcriptional regulator [Microbacterium sp. KSW2-21]MDU0327047.1 helix-turn-helix transcriptional regulator [Microbacterium sp. KSW2-21]